MSETKQCPYCSEEILETAKKCKHCGEYIDGELRKARAASSSKQEKIVVEQKSSGAVQFLVILAIIALIALLTGL
jgi:uncharacterized membrane protein YvbJ